MYRTALLALAAAASASAASLDSVLSSNSDLSEFVKYLKASSLYNDLNGLSSATIFAPTNSAFQTMKNNYPNLINPTNNNPDVLAITYTFIDVLMYHVIPGQVVTSSDVNMYPGSFFQTYYDSAPVNPYMDMSSNMMVYSAQRQLSTVASNMTYDNGVIYTIDSVLMPPEGPATTALRMGFTYFYGALEQTGLVDTFNNTNPITVFIPTNEAFMEVGSSLAALNSSELTEEMRYHAVSGEAYYYPTQLSNLDRLNTMAATSFTNEFPTVAYDAETELLVKVNDGPTGNGAVFVNNARVITPNILFRNGVGFLIDEVLNYKSGDPNYRFHYDLKLGFPASGVVAFMSATSEAVPALTSGITQSLQSTFSPTATLATATYNAGGVTGVALPGAVMGLGMVAAGLVGMV